MSMQNILSDMDIKDGSTWSVFEWFKNSPWYFMKQYFGVPFQEFGNKCCKLYNQTVCCNDKLYNINGYGRLIPYIISVILICYVPLILLKVAKITNTLHPNYYHDFDNISDNVIELIHLLLHSLHMSMQNILSDMDIKDGSTWLPLSEILSKPW
jgi:succinate dehydrogenase hydrophobic anchor subunit